MLRQSDAITQALTLTDPHPFFIVSKQLRQTGHAPTL